MKEKDHSHRLIDPSFIIMFSFLAHHIVSKLYQKNIVMANKRSIAQVKGSGHTKGSNRHHHICNKKKYLIDDNKHVR